MYNIKTTVRIEGDLIYDGNLIGEIPISEEPNNIIKIKNDGLYAQKNYIVFASEENQDPALIPYGNGTEENPLWFQVRNAFIPDNRISTLGGDYPGLYVAPEEISSDPTNIITRKFDQLYAPPTITLVQAQTNYNTLTTTGIYSVPPVTGQDVYTYNAPFDSFTSTSNVILYVQQYGNYFTQIAYGVSQFGNMKNAFMSRTGTIGSNPTWETNYSRSLYDSVYTKTALKETLDVSFGFGGSQIYGYKVTGMSYPNSLPSQKEGVGIWLESGYKNSTQGTFAGVTLAADTDGKVYVNPEFNQPTATKTWNWKELISSGTIENYISKDPTNQLSYLKTGNFGLFVPKITNDLPWVVSPSTPTTITIATDPNKTLLSETLYVNADRYDITIDITNIGNNNSSYELKLATASTGNGGKVIVTSNYYFWSSTHGYVRSETLSVSSSYVLFKIINGIGTGPKVFKVI